MADEFANRAVTELVAIKSEAVDLDTNWTKELAEQIAGFNKQTDELARTRTLPLALQMTKMGDDIITVATRLVTEQIERAGESMRTTEQAGLMIGAAAVLLLLGAAVVGRASIARPLIALIKPINELAAGNFNVSVNGVGRKDEVGQIATAVNAMVTQVRETIAELKAALSRIVSGRRGSGHHKGQGH
jgi:methyl-accepting chemotaxis protein